MVLTEIWPVSNASLLLAKKKGTQFREFVLAKRRCKQWEVEVKTPFTLSENHVFVLKM
jgi:hypothetical protein